MTKLNPAAREYLSLNDVAALTGTPYAKIKRDITKGLLPAYHLGHKYFIKLAEAHKYLQVKESAQNIQGYTIKELMAIIPLSYAFFMGQIHKGKLCGIKIGRQYIIPQKVFEDYLKQNKTI